VGSGKLKLKFLGGASVGANHKRTATFCLVRKKKRHVLFMALIGSTALRRCMHRGRALSTTPPKPVDGSATRPLAGRLLAASLGLGACGCLAWLTSGEDGAPQWGAATTAALRLARVDAALRPAIGAAVPPEVFVALYSSTRTAFLAALAAAAPAPAATHTGGGGRAAPVRAAVEAMGLRFRNDLGNAAGLDKDGALLAFAYRLGAGYAVVGTVLSAPHAGNVFGMLGGLWRGNAWTPLPQSGAALNSLGLPSKGVDAALANIAAFRESHGIAPQTGRGSSSGSGGAGAGGGSSNGDGGVSGSSGNNDFPIGISIMGHPAHGADPQRKLQGVLDCVRKSLPLADFIEINESCPNVDHGAGGGGSGGGGGGKAHDEELAARLRAVVAVRDEAAAAKGGDGRRVPLLVKLGDLGADAGATVRFLAGLGVDGVVALNTQKDYAAFDLPAADRALLEHYTERYGGGLSGPPVLRRSSEQVEAAAAAAARAPAPFAVVHVGGLESNADVQRSRATGAPLRQWYTGLMHGLAQPEPHKLYARVTALST
jgi:dihydroorotate dehydrogenase